MISTACSSWDLGSAREVTSASTYTTERGLPSAHGRLSLYIESMDTTCDWFEIWKLERSNDLVSRISWFLQTLAYAKFTVAPLWQKYVCFYAQGISILQWSSPICGKQTQAHYCRYLRGTCSIENCPFSHEAKKEKVPVCLHFLRGCCVRDHCPYLHVNVGKNAPICQSFAERRYCHLGEKVRNKVYLHLFAFTDRSRLLYLWVWVAMWASQVKSILRIQVSFRIW